MVILMDDENRENEGDLCMAAEKVTPEAINFMAKYGRGLICLALTEERIRELGLPMMVAENRAPAGHRVHRVDRRAPRHHQRHLGRRPRRDDPDGDARPAPARRTSSCPGTSFRCAPAAAACWCAPGRPRAPSTWRASPASSRPA